MTKRRDSSVNARKPHTSARYCKMKTYNILCHHFQMRDIELKLLVKGFGFTP